MVRLVRSLFITASPNVVLDVATLPFVLIIQTNKLNNLTTTLPHKKQYLTTFVGNLTTFRANLTTLLKKTVVSARSYNLTTLPLLPHFQGIPQNFLRKPGVLRIVATGKGG